MRNTRLIGPTAASWQEIVRGFGAMQAQDYGPAKWSLGHRARNLSDSDIDRALNEGSILRTHALRPTWHFVLSEDIRWILELTGPRIHAKNGTAYKELGIDSKLGTKSNRLITHALKNGNALTRKELQLVLHKGGVQTDSRRLSFLMSYAQIEGVICSGPLSGKKQTYALIDERAPRAKRLSADEALAELTLRYFTSHGPATLRDFNWWSSLKISDIKRGIEMVGSKLISSEVEGRRYWYARRGPRPIVESPLVHLLQAYDEYLVGYSESKDLLNLSGLARRLADRTLYLGVVTLDGQLAGHWRRRVSKNVVHFDVALYRLFRGDRLAALHRTVDRHANFVGLAPDLSITRFARR